MQANAKIQQYVIETEETENNKHEMFVYIQSGCLFLVLVVWLLLSLPKTLEVTQINARVLSLVNYN